MCQWVAAEDVSRMAHVVNTERENVECVIEEEQAHGEQVAALLQM